MEERKVRENSRFQGGCTPFLVSEALQASACLQGSDWYSISNLACLRA